MKLTYVIFVVELHLFSFELNKIVFTVEDMNWLDLIIVGTKY